MVGFLGLLGMLLVGFGLDAISSDDLEPAEPKSGDNTLTGTSGADDLAGGAGNGLLPGQHGDETLSGDLGDDTLRGEPGDDLIAGDKGGDLILGGLGADTLSGGFGADRSNSVLRDADGAILANDLDQADELQGGADNHSLFLATGDHATGDTGADDFYGSTWVDPGKPAVIEDYDAANDALFVIHDDGATGPQVITIADSGGDAFVSLNGQAIMRVIGAAGTVAPDMVQAISLDLTS